MQTSAECEKGKTVTFRIYGEVLQKLRDYSNFDRLTLNAFVNKLLYHAINWNIPASKSGLIVVEKSILTRILDRLDDKTIMEIVQTEGKNTPEELTIAMTGNFDVDGLISLLRLRSTASGFQYHEVKDGNTMKFIISHSTGNKYSIFLKAFYEYSFKQLGCPVESKTTENTIMFQIHNKFIEKKSKNTVQIL